jgi:hypothetical protein
MRCESGIAITHENTCGASPESTGASLVVSVMAALPVCPSGSPAAIEDASASYQLDASEA